MSLFSHTPIGCSAVETSPIVIDSDSDFVAYGYRGSGLKGDPYIIEALKVDSRGNMSNGIEVVNTHASFVITRCEIKADYIGILIHNVAPGTATLDRNIITGNTGDGGGIVLGADGVRVVGNNCTGFTEGIHTNYSNDCVIAGNDLSHNSYHGVSLRFSNGNLVVNNTIVRNGAHGVFVIRSSQGNRIYNNTLIDNAKIDSYDWDSIYHFEVKSQALDEGVGNTWFSEELKLGNRWSDYGGTGGYKIDGSVNSIDRYPMKLGETQSEENKPEDKTGQGVIPGFPIEALVLGVGLVILFSFKHGVKRHGFCLF